MVSIRTSAPKVTVVIVHFKGLSNLIDCIVSLNKVSYENFDIQVIQNSAKDAVLSDRLRHADKHICKVIQAGQNLGFAAANNIGIREGADSNSDYVLLLNDDTLVAPDFLTELVEVAEMHEDVAMLGPQICYFDEPQKIWFDGATFEKETCQVVTRGSGQTDRPLNESTLLESDYICGCCLLVRTNMLDQIGLLDERFFLYWEDVDWGLRMMKAKRRNAIVPSAYIWHKISASTGGPDSPLKAYHKTRSHLLFSRLHAPGTHARLIEKYGRDILWLLVKSAACHRIVKARAYFAAIVDYYLGRTDRGPGWLWEDI
jgi:GT2 family glycosyltransferase